MPAFNLREIIQSPERLKKALRQLKDRATQIAADGARSYLLTNYWHLPGRGVLARCIKEELNVIIDDELAKLKEAVLSGDPTKMSAAEFDFRNAMADAGKAGAVRATTEDPEAIKINKLPKEEADELLTRLNMPITD